MDLVHAGFETLVEAGYQPEIAYFECLHELKLIVDLAVERGIAGMSASISNTAAYGGMTRGPKIIDSHARERLRECLNQVRSGSFAREWINESENKKVEMRRLLNEQKKHPIEEVARHMRQLTNPTSKSNPSET